MQNFRGDAVTIIHSKADAGRLSEVRGDQMDRQSNIEDGGRAVVAS